MILILRGWVVWASVKFETLLELLAVAGFLLVFLFDNWLKPRLLSSSEWKGNFKLYKLDVVPMTIA